jgi:hypothetical protein
MPPKSEAQRRFMQAVAHSPQFAKAAGVPSSVGQGYTQADSGRKLPQRVGPPPAPPKRPQTRGR